MSSVHSASTDVRNRIVAALGRWRGSLEKDDRPLFERFVKRWGKAQCRHRRGLLSEADVQEIIKNVYDSLKQMGELSLGMDDFLMATASEHETNQYLLRQVLRSKESAGN